MSWKTFLFPPRCILCRDYIQIQHPDGLCDGCRRQMQAERELHLHRSLSYVWVAAAAEYGGAMRSALLRVKSYAVRASTVPMGDLLYQAYREQLPEFQPDLVTYVPSSARRNRERGFTLSEEMAKVVAQRLGVPCRPTLHHALFAAKQAELKGSKRKQNAEKSFALLPKTDLSKQKVLLVDDIIASGTTINFCAKLLDAAGAAEIVGLVLAKSGQDR